MKSLVVRKLAALADSLADLKEQLRAAVATEVGRAVAAAVREILEVLIARRELPRWEKPGPGGHDGFNDPDDWDDPYSPYRPRQRPDDEEDPKSFADPSVSPAPLIPAASLALALNAGHWLWRLSRSWLCGA
ncbi:hypothetical protein, partial [Zavarzinella formosa]|uniref:hypothetical protein n=1 Tax=Zavarzinella formosa TaxID=360055 RepID=UPI00049783FD